MSDFPTLYVVDSKNLNIYEISHHTEKTYVIFKDDNGVRKKSIAKKEAHGPFKNKVLAVNFAASAKALNMKRLLKKAEADKEYRQGVNKLLDRFKLVI